MERLPLVALRWLSSGRFLWFVVGLGIVFRIVSAALISIGFDGNYYVAMGVSFASHGEFLLPWGDPGSSGMPASFSHHLSPLWPMVLGAAFALLGPSVAVVKGVSLAVSLIVLPVAYWATADLYGRNCALAVCAALAVMPELILDVGRAYSENLTMILFVLTIWGIMKSLRDRRFMVWAGLAAGLAYLSRASVGYFFIVAGLAGLAWRFHFMRFDVFRDRSYLAAIGIFGLLVGGWGLRNIVRFGFPHWETDAMLTSYAIAAVSEPATYIVSLVLTLFFFSLLLFSIAMYFIPEITRSIRQIRSEEESGLWLAVLLIPGVAAFIAAVFSQLERSGPGVFGMDRIRYVIFAYYPMLCIPLREIGRVTHSEEVNPSFGNPARRLMNERARWRILVFLALALGSTVFSLWVKATWLVPMFLVGSTTVFLTEIRGRLVILLVVLILVSAEVATSVTHSAEEDVVDYIATTQNLPAIVAFDGPQSLYYNLSTYAMGKRITLVNASNVSQATFVVSNNGAAQYPGFVEVRTFYNRRIQGIIQSFVARILGQTTEEFSSPLFLFRRT